jgi:uncharacterized protein YycO
MQPVYQLDPTRLLPGDVILEKGDSLYSRVIRLSDRGRFSHVILYLGANFIVEAVEEGVRIMQALRVITADPRTALRAEQTVQLERHSWNQAAILSQKNP